MLSYALGVTRVDRIRKEYIRRTAQVQWDGSEANLRMIMIVMMYDDNDDVPYSYRK